MVLAKQLGGPHAMDLLARDVWIGIGSVGTLGM